jgi:SOS response regulatory protein OraA/RecX
MLTDRFNKTNIMFANELSNDLLNDSQIIKSIADSDNTKLSQQIESALKIQKIIKNRIEMLLQSDIKVDD